MVQDVMAQDASWCLMSWRVLHDGAWSRMAHSAGRRVAQDGSAHALSCRSVTDDKANLPLMT